MNCHLAVDIGASSGRIMASFLQENQLELQEIYRFSNGISKKNGHLCWDIEHLYESILLGIESALSMGYTPISIGVDTWAVDFVLLDENDQLLTDTISYRDHRTDGMMDEVFKVIPKEILYKKTGIQFLQFNTIYQLMAIKKENPEVLQKATSFLMIPDYLHFLLSGVKNTEYTNATTTQLINAISRDWDRTILSELGIKEEIFPPIVEPATFIGSLSKDLIDRFGIDIKIVAPATHDTGSAILSIPCHEEKTIYISSGTWSLMGIEHHAPIINDEALRYNFTNEGSVLGKTRFLKNIMGMWIIQEIRRHYDSLFTFEELVEFASSNADFPSLIDVNNSRFLSPKDMLQEMQDYCEETHQKIPYEIGEFVSCAYNSLAKSYAMTVKEIEKIQNESYEAIYIIGGGSKNNYLNQLIANETGKKVYAGLSEATAIGNSIAQMIACGEVENVDAARTIISNTFTRDVFEQIVEETMT